MSGDEVLDEFQRLLMAAERVLLPASQARLVGAAEQTREAKATLASLRPSSSPASPTSISEATPR